MHDPARVLWASSAASRSLARTALFRASADDANAVVSFDHESLFPRGGSFLPMSPARRAYSLDCGVIVSHAGGSASSSLPMTGVSEAGPFVSLPMICLTVGESPSGPVSAGAPRPGPGPPRFAIGPGPPGFTAGPEAGTGAFGSASLQPQAPRSTTTRNELDSSAPRSFDDIDES